MAVVARLGTLFYGLLLSDVAVVARPAVVGSCSVCLGAVW